MSVTIYVSIGIYNNRALDTVDHTILCSKLEHYGIQGNMLKLLNNYLTGRDQYVMYANKPSNKLPIVKGVPQGSVLGPLLFILFINDIINSTDAAKFVLYADDSNLFLSNLDRFALYDTANIALQNIFLYCSANKIMINVVL